VRELEMLEPHGMGNPRPQFRTNGLKVKTNPIPLTPLTTEFYVTDGSYVYEALWSGKSDRESSAYNPGVATSADLRKDQSVNIVYSIKLKIWEGRPRVALEIKDVEILS